MKKILFLLFLTAPGLVLSAQSAASVDQMMKVTGVEAQMTNTMDSMGPSIAAQAQMAPGANGEKIAQAMEKSYTAATVNKAIKDALMKSGKQDLINKILKTYESDVMKKATAEEVAFSKAEAEKALQNTEPETPNITPERKALIQGFLISSKMTEQTSMLVKSIFDGFLMGLEVLDKEQYEKVESIFKSMGPMLEAQFQSEAMQTMMVNRLALTYKNLSDKELQIYFGFYSSPEGRWMTEVLIQGMSEGFLQCSKAAAKAITAPTPNTKI